MMVGTEEVAAEVDTTEIADHLLTTKTTDRVMIGHVPVLILHVSILVILIDIFYPSTLSGHPAIRHFFSRKAYFINLRYPIIFSFWFFSGYSHKNISIKK